MSFGNPRIFPFPAVQYIPLPLTVIRQEHVNLVHLHNLPQLMVGIAPLQWKTILVRDYGIEPLLVCDQDCLPLLALELEIDDIKYRGYFVTMTGRSKPGFYQIGTIPKRFFYKKNLIFEIYDPESAKRLVRQAATL